MHAEAYLDQPLISFSYPAASPAETWLLHFQTAPAPTPWISVTPPAHIALSGSRFAAAQDELLRPGGDGQATDSGCPPSPAVSSAQPSDELPASPLPVGLRYVKTPLMSTPRDDTSVDSGTLQTDLTPLLASLLALGEDEGRGLLEPVLLDWASDYDSTEGSCFTLASESDCESSRTAPADLSPRTPATPLSPRERLGKFTRSSGLSPSPGRVEFARATFCDLSDGNVPTAHLSSPSSTVSTLDSPTPPLRVKKSLPAKLLLGRPSRSSSLPPKMLPSSPALSVGGKENTFASNALASRPTPPVKQRRNGLHGQYGYPFAPCRSGCRLTSMQPGLFVSSDRLSTPIR